VVFTSQTAFQSKLIVRPLSTCCESLNAPSGFVPKKKALRLSWKVSMLILIWSPLRSGESRFSSVAVMPRWSLSKAQTPK